jgi:hypothetical protein
MNAFKAVRAAMNSQSVLQREIAREGEGKRFSDP